MKIGLIGNGAIASVVTDHCEGTNGRIEIVGATVLASDGPSVGGHPTFKNLGNLLALGPDMIVECAGQKAVSEYGPEILKAGIGLMVISVGALADADLLKTLDAQARTTGAKVIIPAGALAGLDAITAARIDGLERITLRTRKLPMAWSGAPGVDGVDLEAIAAPTVIFRGSAGDAARAFPKNANVAAAVAIAGIGMENTQVELIADPGVRRNIHHIAAEGVFGRLEIDVQAEPSPDNPKTSHLAALSIIRQLDKLTENIQI
ncbi:MAG: aspartate dehydrogenase [Rhodospirillaceae bacterium]|nr:aspartate dehydrogenase [Rhodospirillaceae bacterium]